MTRPRISSAEEGFRCLFCHAPLAIGAFCSQCVSLKRIARMSLASAAVHHVDPVVGPLVKRNGPHSYLLMQPLEGTWDT